MEAMITPFPDYARNRKLFSLEHDAQEAAVAFEVGWGSLGGELARRPCTGLAPPGGGGVYFGENRKAAGQTFLTNSDFRLIAPKPSILQSMS
jgi:hypothetical protein